MVKRSLKIAMIMMMTVIMIFGCVNVDVYASEVSLAKGTITSVSVGDKKMTVKYKKITNAGGYRIAYRKKGTSTWHFKNVSASTLSVTIKNLTKGAKYYTRVRAYKELDGKTYYGEYSDSKLVTILTSRQIKEQKIVSVAKSKLGCKYRYGSTGPNTFDCSGFTSYVLKKAANISIPRTSSSQHNGGKQVSIKNLKVGDIVWRSGHVGLYVGDGKVIHSPHTGDVVRYTSASKFKCGVRYF